MPKTHPVIYISLHPRRLPINSLNLNLRLLASLFFLLLGSQLSYGALPVKCDSFTVADTITMDYFFDDEIIRNKAIYSSGAIQELYSYKKANHPFARKHYAGALVDSLTHFDPAGRVDYKIHYKYTPARKVLLTTQFSTHQSIVSKFIFRSDDVAVKTVETFEHGTKMVELVYKNEKLSRVTLCGNEKPKAFTRKTDMDSVVRTQQVPFLEEDLTGRPQTEIEKTLKSTAEMRNFVSRCIARYPQYGGKKILVEFPILRDGSVPGVLLLKSEIPCKKLCIDLLNVIKNTPFLDNKQYGTVTVTFPFEY